MKRTLGVLLLISATVLCLAAAPAAQATFTMTPQVDFATDPIAVGSSGAGSLTFSNDSTAGEDADSIDRIVLEPSCRLPGSTPPCLNRDPGIFAISSGTGVTGTSCQGITFNVNLGAAPFGGSLEFTPQGGLGTIPNMPANASCVINFTYTALAVPTFDTQGETGVQTDQLAEVRAEHNGGGPESFGPGTGDTTVTPAPPAAAPAPTPTLSPAPAPAPAPKKKCKKAKKRSAAAAKKCKKKK